MPVLSTFNGRVMPKRSGWLFFFVFSFSFFGVGDEACMLFDGLPAGGDCLLVWRI